MASLPNPSEFAVSVAVGSAHVLGSLGGATGSPVAAALLALPVLAAYLAAVTLAFAARVAADCYAIVVACGAGDAPDTVPRLLFSALLLAFASALFQFSSN